VKERMGMGDEGRFTSSLGIIQRLRSIPALQYFGEEDLKKILESSRMIRYEPHEAIISEGQCDSWIYFIIYGRVSIQKQGETIGILKDRGDIFGEMGIIDGSPRSATVVAQEDTVCLAIDASYLDRLPKEDRSAFESVLYQVLAQTLAGRLRITDEALVRAREEIARLKTELARDGALRPDF
jgi:CRP/FNR family cyclic AMP-dependent transcriptional regulator